MIQVEEILDIYFEATGVKVAKKDLHHYRHAANFVDLVDEASKYHNSLEEKAKPLSKESYAVLLTIASREASREN